MTDNSKLKMNDLPMLKCVNTSLEVFMSISELNEFFIMDPQRDLRNPINVKSLSAGRVALWVMWALAFNKGEEMRSMSIL